MAEETKKITPSFADKTKVPVAQTRMDIETLLNRYGATSFIVGNVGNMASLMFELSERRIRFSFLLPTEADIPTHDSTGRPLNRGNKPGAGSVATALEQARRTRWRELYLGIKAKLVLVDAGITTIEEEFMSATIMANGMTVNEWVQPQLRKMYLSGQMPPLLPGLLPPGRESEGE